MTIERSLEKEGSSGGAVYMPRDDVQDLFPMTKTDLQLRMKI